MATKALIVTPSKGFGELIRQVLADGSSLEPVLVSSGKQAVEAARLGDLDLVVLDVGLGSLDLSAILAELRKLAPDVHVIVIPSEENPTDPQLATLGADAILPSPFYLPNLVAAIEQLYGPLRAKEEPKRVSFGSAPVQLKSVSHRLFAAPDWLQEVDLAAQVLTRLSLESASQAALITRAQKVWAYAGELPQPAAEELAFAVSQHVAAGESADLARFIHLKATKADYMLYATSLGGDYALALVFDTQVPFSQMRAQVSKLAAALATAPQPALSLRENDLEPLSRPAEREPQPVGFEPELPRVDMAGETRTAAAGSGPSRPISQALRLEPSLAGGHDLRYSYVLIPRLPAHRLEGDLAEKLGQWLPQLCIAFAWRLESISIQPELLQWMVSVPPDISAETAAITLDQHLSDRIFEEFPRLKRENPSGHFFAPGFLVASGAVPATDLVAQFIQQTRTRQGVVR